MELTWLADGGHADLLILDSPTRELDRLALVPSALRDLAPLQPTAGQFEATEDGILFRPRFLFVPGTSYSVLVDGHEVARAVYPASTAEPVARVVGLYPAAAQVPLNLLRTYVQFSHPMSEGWATRAVQVRRADDGQLLEGVFLPMEPELWDRARQRLTLLLDPGRIKRGLAPHEAVGYPLVAGVPVVVAIDPAFRDAEGRPLQAGAERRYEVGPAVRAHVDPARWEVNAPLAGTRDGLTVRFDRPLDHALLQACLAVTEPDGRSVDGDVAILADQRAWRFTPLQPWRAQAYALLVDPRLEDLAGNSLRRVFDRDLTRPEDDPVEIKQSVALPFPVGTPVWTGQ